MGDDDGYVYGREYVLRRIVKSTASAVVITGDSGVGKSTVLRAAQRMSTGFAPPAVPVGAGPGALSRALSSAVTLALAAHIDDAGQLPVFRERLLAASRKLRHRASERVREDLTNLLIDQVRMRLGETAAEIVAETRSAWNESEQDSIQQRLATLTETDVALALTEVASDLADIADADVLLALDDAHLLGDEDLRRLRDLVAEPTARVRLRVAYTTVGAALDAALTRLQEAGADRVALQGLDEGSVRSWLTREGIDVGHTNGVMVATLGYALHVGDAIRLLRAQDASGSLDDLSQADVVQRGSDRAWAALSNEDRHAVMLLLPFAYHPGAQRISSLLGIDVLRWAVLRERLAEGGVLVQRGNDSWFHGLRRQALWRRIDETTKTVVGTRGIQSILDLESVTYEDVDVVSTLLSHADLDTAVQDESARGIAALSDDAVSVAAAVMDLSGRSVDEAFVPAAGALLRAHERYAAPANSLPAMRELESANAVHLASNERAAVVAPRWSLPASVLIAARTLRRTGYIPFPGLAGFIVEVLRPRLGAWQLSLVCRSDRPLS